jgi:hypothetical protein
MNAAQLKVAHGAGLRWEEYLATAPEKAAAWRRVHAQVELDERQRRLLSLFTRRMPVLCVSGIWCGDCAQQGPMLQRIAEGSPCIDLRFVDRDEHPALARAIMINGGARVPVVLFMAEDHAPISVMGDRTITRYRALAARALDGPSCPRPGAPLPSDELRTTLQDWLDEFERVHLLLRLSGRLREIHHD